MIRDLAICVPCWNKKHKDAPANPASEQGPDEVCNYCGEPTRSGIYVRGKRLGEGRDRASVIAAVEKLMDLIPEGDRLREQMEQVLDMDADHENEPWDQTWAWDPEQRYLAIELSLTGSPHLYCFDGPRVPTEVSVFVDTSESLALIQTLKNTLTDPERGGALLVFKGGAKARSKWTTAQPPEGQRDERHRLVMETDHFSAHKNLCNEIAVMVEAADGCTSEDCEDHDP